MLEIKQPETFITGKASSPLNFRNTLAINKVWTNLCGVDKLLACARLIFWYHTQGGCAHLVQNSINPELHHVIHSVQQKIKLLYQPGENKKSRIREDEEIFWISFHHALFCVLSHAAMMRVSPSAAVIRSKYFSILREVQLRVVRPGRMALSTLATCGMSSCSKAGWILDLTREFSVTISYVTNMGI